MLYNFQAQFLTGLNFEMNGLPSLEDHNLATMSFSSFHIPQQQKPSKYCFTAFNSFCHLKYLNLSGNIIGQFVIFMILKNLSDKACLTHLVLNSCSIGPKRQYIDQISNFQCIQKLEHLELANNRLDSVDHMMKLFYKCCNTLFYLNLEMNGFRSDSLPAIQKLLKNPFHLKILSIGKNQLSSNDIQQPNTSFCLVKFWHISWMASLHLLEKHWNTNAVLSVRPSCYQSSNEYSIMLKNFFNISKQICRQILF